jgi:hypothetical protein
MINTTKEATGTQQATIGHQDSFDAIFNGAPREQIKEISFDEALVKDLTDSLVADSLSGVSPKILYALMTATQKDSSLMQAIIAQLELLYVV